MNWKKELKQLKLEYIKSKSPGFFEQSGGYSMKVKQYRDDSSNSLTTAICDFLKFKGHYSNRINTQGQARKERIELAGGNYLEKVKFTHGTTNRGTADIMACINGKHIAIEVKVGRDRMSEAQHKEQKRIEAAGGIYFLAKDFPAFFEWYNKTFDNEK